MDSSSVSRRRTLPGAIALSVFCCLVAAALGSLMATPVQAAPARAPAEQGCSAIVTVTNNADSGPGSLRQALADVCAGGMVDFDATLAGATISLISAQLTLDKNVTITGTVPITLSGNNAVRVLYVTPGANVTLSSLTLTQGNPGPGESGGAVNNYGTLLIVNSLLTGSTAEGGGAIYNDSAAILTMMGSRISGNTSTTAGGGIANFGALTVTNSTIDTNQAATTGGGVINAKEMTLTASTVADNQAPSGAGIFNNTGMILKATQITVSGNKATVIGGGLYTHLGVTLSGSVLSGNANGDCLAGDPIGSGGYNVVSDASCSLAGTGDQNDQGPQTLALQPNGTAPLDPLATASHGKVNDAALCANLDQLGYPRHLPACDAGALEANLLYTLTVAKTGTGSGVLTPTVGAHIYVSNTLVSVAAAPVISSTFSGWSGDCTGAGTCAVTLLADKVVTATFALNQYTVTVSADAAAGGTVQGAGTYAYGSTVVVTATTNTGYTFGGWQENSSVVAAGAIYTFTATANRTLVAAFTPICPVTTNADTGPGSLRQAVADAAPGAILCFNPTVSGQTILFASPIVIAKSLTINGNLPVILDGRGANRLFEVNAGGSLSLNALTVRNGLGAAPGGGAILVAGSGALAATSVTFGGNQAAGKGGAILNHGTATVSHSTFSANVAPQGGAIANDGGTATVSSSVFGANNDGSCGGTITSGGYNVAGDNSCNFTARGDINDAPLPVAGVGAYGRTPLTADSLAVNNVTDPTFCTGTDQAGNARPTPCAAGALEFITGATTLYVASGGSDTANNCAGAGSPCATLNRALEVASDGSTIRMAASGTPYIVANQPISKSVLILGDGSGQTILQAGAVPAAANGRVLGVVPGQKVTLYGVTVRFGWTSGPATGGGIVNGGTLTVRNSAVLSNTIVTGNGAGIYNGGGGLLVVYNSTLAGNRVIRQAAAAMVPGTLVSATPNVIPGLPVSALPGLVGLLGGGGMLGLAWTVTGGRPKRPWQRRTLLLFLAMLVLSGCTDSCGSPTDGAGGAIFNDHGSTAVIRFTTLAGNSAYLKGGGFYNAAATYDANGVLTEPPGVLKLAGSVLSQNDGGNCSGGAVDSLGANVSSDISCGLSNGTDANWAGDQVGALGPNGTMPLQTASGAVDLVPAACPGNDQVNVTRPAPCDGGAAESGSPGAARLLVEVSADPGRPYLNQAVVFTATVRNTGAGPAFNPRVTLTWPAGIEPAPFSVTGGTGCSWLSSTLTCTSLAPRSQLVLVMPGRLTTDAPYIPLNLIVAASANAPAVGGTGMGTVITDALPPPPSFAVGPTRYYKTIQSAVNAAPPGETISVDGGTYVETVVITKSLTIQRATVADAPIIDGNKVGSVFFIKSFDARVTLDGLTIRNGTGSYLTGGEHSGGGIFSWGALTVTNCNIIGNTTLYGGEGGGIYSYGELTVRNSTFSGNIGTSGGGIAMRRQGSVRHSTFSGNIATRAGGGLYSTSERPESITIQDSIFSGNQAGAGRPDMTTSKLLVVENSIVQAAIDGPNNLVDDPNQPLFVRPPSAGDYGDLRLVANAPARNLGQYCTGPDAQDMVGTTRNTPTCDAGAYEFLSTDTGSGQVAAASAGMTVFPNAGGAVTLTIPTGAAAQAVELAFGIGQPTGGDGRARAVTFTPYDAGGQPLGENFTFLKPLQVTLAYNPTLVIHGPETALLPMRFQPGTGSWLPFTQDVVVDRLSRRVSFPITQVGEYGLFSFTPGAHVTITPFKAGGTTNLDGGSTILYTLAVINANYAPVTNLAISHVLPPGLTFGGWVNAGTATENGGVLTWNLPTLAGGGAAWVSFNALVSADAAYRGQTITSSVTLGGGAGGSSQATISVNGPTTPVDDAASTRPDTPVSVQPLLNDVNPDGSPVLLTGLVAPAHGTATILGATVLYTPTAGFEGTDSFMYRLQDGLFTAQGTITVRVARLAFLNVAMFAASSSAGGFFLPAVAQGSTVSYTILLENMAGGEVAQNAVLTDVLPESLQFTQWITQSGAVLNGRTITWSAATLPVGSGATISYAATVGGPGGATIANTAQASAANADPVSGEAAIILGGWTRLYLPQVRR